jgi:hypothetical protein
MTNESLQTSPRIRRFVDWLIGTYVPAHGLEFGASSDGWIEDPERMERCERAAENGGDGSTHAEHMQDWREAFAIFLRDRKRNTMSAGYDRFEAAVTAYFDSVEAWHVANGSIDEEVG